MRIAEINKSLFTKNLLEKYMPHMRTAVEKI